MEDDNALFKPVRIEYFIADNVFRFAEIRLRFLAFVIDGFVWFGIFIAAVLITDAIMPKVNYFQSPDQLHRTSDIIALIWLVANWLYFAGMESSPCQATFGKLVAGLKVVDESKKRISLARASGRFFGKLLSGDDVLCWISHGLLHRAKADAS